MNQIDYEELLESTINIGRLMIHFGAEVWRVEDTITRICRAYDITNPEVYASTNIIIVTIKTKEGFRVIQSVRIGTIANNLKGLEVLSGLSRKICGSIPPVSEINELTTNALSTLKTTSYNCIGYVIAGSTFTIFFGGTLIDGIVGGIIAFIIFVVSKYIDIAGVNKLLYTMVMCSISGILAILAVKFGIGQNLDKIIIGVVMLFIPTLSLVNGTKDMFHRDIISGVYRVIEAILIATAIAFGFGLSLFLFG